MDLTDRAIKAVREHQPDGRKFRVEKVVSDFLDGVLVFIEFEDADRDDDENYVYVTSTDAIAMSDFEDVASLVARYRPISPLHRFAREFVQTSGIAGAIGLLIAVTICYLVAVKGQKDISPVLSGALTTVLGFYFGSKTIK